MSKSYEYRTRIGVKIAEAFRWLHTIHVRIGDVNPSNILVNDNGSVMLIDCDSFQIPGPPGHQPYPCVVGSPEYTAPEIDDFRRQFPVAGQRQLRPGGAALPAPGQR